VSDSSEASRVEVGGPWFEDLAVGQEYDAPAVTLTEGHASLFQALSGDRLRLPLDHYASQLVTGRTEPLAHPLLVINMAIGQSTWASQRVKANLFYRGLVLHRPCTWATRSTLSRASLPCDRTGHRRAVRQPASPYWK